MIKPHVLPSHPIIPLSPTPFPFLTFYRSSFIILSSSFLGSYERTYCQPHPLPHSVILSPHPSSLSVSICQFSSHCYLRSFFHVYFLISLPKLFRGLSLLIQLQPSIPVLTTHFRSSFSCYSPSFSSSLIHPACPPSSHPSLLRLLPPNPQPNDLPSIPPSIPHFPPVHCLNSTWSITMA